MNNRNLRGQTPLHATAEMGATEVVRLYIQMGADMMAQDKDGQTPLHLAAKNAHGPVVRELLKLDPVVRELLELQQVAMEQDHWRRNRMLLYIAASEKDNGTFTSRLSEAQPRLASQGNQQTLARVNARDKDGRTALHYAAEEAEKEEGKEVIRLLVESGASVNTCDSQGCAALPAALEWGMKNRYHKIVRRLLEQGVDGENGGLDYGQRTLGLAVDYKDMDIILQLVEDCGVNLKTPSGQKALIFVVESDNLSILERIIAKVADVDTDFEGKTVLYMAAEKRKWRIVEMLKEKGANIDTVYEGKTALFRALEAYDFSIVRKLVEIGANVDAKMEGGTALWHRRGLQANMLAEMGADVNFEYKGETALSRAASRKKWSTVKALIRLGANVNVLVDGLPLLSRVRDEDLHNDGRELVISRFLPKLGIFLPVSTPTAFYIENLTTIKILTYSAPNVLNR